MQRRHLTLYTSLCTALLITAGCASHSQVVRPGDKAELSFSCRLANGDLVVTTRHDAAVSYEKKSALYLPRNKGGELKVVAGQSQTREASRFGKSLEQEVVDQLALSLVGQPEGVVVARTVSATVDPAAAADKPTSLARIRKRAKEMRLSIEEYRTKTGKQPEVGRTFTLDPLFPGAITQVTDKEVVIAFAPKSTGEVSTPFGPAIISDAGTQYEMRLNPQVGQMLRSGPMAGRVVTVDNDNFTIDYRHPFAGETFNCLVQVDEVTADKTVTKQTEAVAVPAVTNAGQAPAAVAAGKPEDALAKSFHEFMASGAVVAAGDLATVDYTATLADGTLVYTTLQAVANDPARKKAAWYQSPTSFQPEELVAGKQGLLPGIGEAVNGLAIGGKKQLALTPEQAFGPHDPKQLVQLPRNRNIPRQLALSAEEYVKRFGTFPVVGKSVELTPYFPATVTKVSEREVQVEFQVKDGATFTDTFGTTTVTVAGDVITTQLQPIIGAQFPVQNGVGSITTMDDTNFSVDLNHPLAGKSISIELELRNVTKAANLPKDLPWQESHDTALAAARQAGKPAVLVLYADWCSFCTKLFSETMPDPRITALRDRFAWVKVNSDQLTDIKKLYGQEGYPMTVLFKADGSIGGKIDGFKDAAAFRAALQGLL